MKSKKALSCIALGIIGCLGIAAGWHYRHETVIPLYYFIRELVYSIIIRPVEPLINTLNK